MSIQILYQVEKFVFMNIYPVDYFLSCLLSFLKKKNTYFFSVLVYVCMHMLYMRIWKPEENMYLPHLTLWRQDLSMNPKLVI